VQKNIKKMAKIWQKTAFFRRRFCFAYRECLQPMIFVYKKYKYFFNFFSKKKRIFYFAVE